MRKVVPFILILLLICTPSMSGCTVVTHYFDGTVTWIGDDCLLVNVTASNTDALESGGSVLVSTKDISLEKYPDIQEGQTIRVEFDGTVLLSYPAQLQSVYAIYLLDAEQ